MFYKIYLILLIKKCYCEFYFKKFDKKVKEIFIFVNY